MIDDGDVMTECWKTVGWNGIRLSVPEGWETTGIERRCLVFAENSRPVMTLKWEPLLRRGATRTGVSRIRRALPRRLRRGLREIPVPDRWREALAGHFERQDIAAAAAFSWGDSSGGDGLLLECRRTGRVFLLHLYRMPGSGLPGESMVVPGILASLGDGVADGRVLWAVFDFQARVPTSLTLMRYRFIPGAFELTFGAAKTTVRLCRWAPASVLLGGTSLAALAADRFDIPLENIGAGGGSVEWVDRNVSAWSMLPMTGFLMRPVVRRGRAWHIAGYNKILAVGIAARSLPDASLLDELCESFQCVQADAISTGYDRR